MSKLISISDAAKELAVSPDTVRRLIRSSDILHVRVSRRVLIPAEEVARVAQSGAGRYARRNSN